jgi:hypothetical protein
VLIFSIPAGPAAAFKASADERWVMLGTVNNSQCAGVREALRDGKFQLTQPQFKELTVNHQRLRIEPGCQ